MKQQSVPLHEVSPLHPWYAAPSLGTQMYGPMGFPSASMSGAQVFDEHSAPVVQRQVCVASVAASQTLVPPFIGSQHAALAGHSELVVQFCLQERLPSPSSTQVAPASQQAVGHLMQEAAPPFPLLPPLPPVTVAPPVPAELAPPMPVPPAPAPPLVEPATVPPVPPSVAPPAAAGPLDEEQAVARPIKASVSPEIFMSAFLPYFVVSTYQ